MNQKGFINILLIVIVVALVGAGVYFITTSRQITPLTSVPSHNPIPSPIPLPTPASKAPTPGFITVQGKVVCLPKKGPDTHIRECAIGLQGTDGRYYGLSDLSQYGSTYSTIGWTLEISGVFRPEKMSAPDGVEYGVAGIIDIDSLKIIPGPLGFATNSPLPNAVMGRAYNQTINAFGSGEWKIVLKVTAGSLPQGLKASCCSGEGGGLELRGTPTKAGTYTFTVTAIDGTKEVSKQFTLEVLELRPR